MYTGFTWRNVKVLSRVKDELMDELIEIPKIVPISTVVSKTDGWHISGIDNSLSQPVKRARGGVRMPCTVHSITSSHFLHPLNTIHIN